MPSKKPKRSTAKPPSRKARWQDKKRRQASYYLEAWPRAWWEGPLYARAIVARATPVEAAYLATSPGLFDDPGKLPPLVEIRSVLEALRPIATLEEAEARDAIEAGLDRGLRDPERIKHVTLRVQAIKHDYEQAKKKPVRLQGANLRADLGEVTKAADKLDRLLKREGVTFWLGIAAQARARKDGDSSPSRVEGQTLHIAWTDIPGVAALAARPLSEFAATAAGRVHARAGNPGEGVIPALVNVLASCVLDAADADAWRRMESGHYVTVWKVFLLVAKALGDKTLARVTEERLREYLP